MAEESINSPLSPDIIKVDGGSSRRNSTGKAVSSNRGEKILPHYLRASTGSCHDFCKYGREHAFESKPRHPIPKTIVTKRPDGQNPVANLVVPERKKTLAVKFKPVPDSKTHTPDAGNIIKQERSAKSPSGQNLAENEVLSKKKKTVIMVTPSPNSKIHSSDSPQIVNPEVPPSSEKAVVSSKRASLKVEVKNLSAKPAASLKAESVGVSSGRRNNDNNILKRTEASKVTVRKVFTPSAASFSLKPSLSRAGSLNRRKLKSMKVVSRKAELKQPNNGEVQEKTLYVVKMNTEIKPPESDENVDQPVGTYPVPSSSSPKSLSHEEEEDQEESEYTESEAEDNSILENNEIVNLENAVTLEAEKDRTPRKYMDGQPVKLNFRRGTVVDIQSENNGPRRLRFRRGRVLGESQNVKAEARGRSIKAKEVVDSVKVVLKHQDLQGKKKSPVLFNNVIEETASKLVETRKSKVKALVGAFETVISLQENKPSSNTVLLSWKNNIFP